MNATNRIMERIKTALIVILLISALLLGRSTKLFNDFFSMIPLFGSVAELMRNGAGVGEAKAAALKEAARPLCIAITNAEGERYGARYDTDARNAVYDRTSSIMGEALGSATAFTEVFEGEWQAALKNPGVYFEYITPVRLSILNGWLAAHMPIAPGDVTLRRVFIAFGEEKSRIYYQDCGSGLFFGADTATSAEKAQELGIYAPNGAVFAYESNLGIAGDAPYMLIMPGNEYAEVKAAYPGEAEALLDAAILALGHSNEQYTTFSDWNGVVRSVGTQFNISMDTKGNMLYHRTDMPPPDPDNKPLSENELIELARAVAEKTVGRNCGEADVFFETLEARGANSWAVVFKYYVFGGSVHLQDDSPAARISVTEGIVTAIELCYRSFSSTGTYAVLLPERQTLAAAGSEFMLNYPETGAEALQPVWIRRDI